MTLELPEGWTHLPEYFDQGAQMDLIETLRTALKSAPLFKPVMPRSGRPFSVEMMNFGPLGWVSDKKGYRYQPRHPDTGQDWPPMPAAVLGLWRKISGYAHDPEACLLNYYAAGAKMGLHRDADEEDLEAPVVSISLGDTGIFSIGHRARGGKTIKLALHSGDVLIMGGPARLTYHGLDRVLPGTSSLLKNGGRLNLTLRRVTRPRAVEP